MQKSASRRSSIEMARKSLTGIDVLALK